MRNELYNIDEIKRHLHTALTGTEEQKNFLDRLNKLLPAIRVKGFSDFFINIPVTMNYQFQHQSIQVEDQSFYLSLFEKTTNFEKTPVSKDTVLVGNSLFVKTDFDIIDQLDCTVTIVFYDEDKFIQSKILSHKNGKVETLLYPPENAKCFRLAIKLEGSGVFRNNEVTIEQRMAFPVKETAPVAKQEPQPEKQDLENPLVKEFKRKLPNYRYRRRIKTHDLKVASILDEFSEECFKYDCDLLPISSEGWQQELADFNPDFLFVESCWNGNGGKWVYEVANLHINDHRVKLKELIDYCRDNGIRTVFWDKEGRENFDFFKEAASYFDFIFTADENNIDNYKTYTGNENVSVLAFAAQPQIHNPIYKGRNYLGKVGFAGSYYSNKHELRQRDIESIIKPALDYGIDIYDRYFGQKAEKYPFNQWPEEYKRNIVGNLQYSQMVEAYKNYDIFINVNSVQDSKYMFARRVFEVLSSGSMVVSGPSVGVEETFGSLVPVVRTEQETHHALKIYTKNAPLREKLIKEGTRYVLQHHTYRNRLQEICDTLGLDKQLLTEPKVSIITSTQRESYMEDVYANLKHQTYPNLEAVIILNKDSMDAGKWQAKFSDLPMEVKVIKLDEELSLGTCLNTAIKRSTGEVIAKFDDDDYYAPEYVTDMVLSMDYSNADIVGKSSHYLHFESNNLLAIKTIGSGEETYSNFVAGATLVFKREVVEKLEGFTDKNRGEDTDFLTRAKDAGFLIYSNDVKNYCCYRRANKSNHTWKIEDEDLLRNCTSHIYTSDTKSPVTF